MGSVLHGCARTTPRIRAELQASQESSRALAARYGLNVKTVRKWRKRPTTADAPMGPKAPKSTVLTPAEEAIVVAFRQKTLLPLDDVLGFVSMVGATLIGFTIGQAFNGTVIPVETGYLLCGTCALACVLLAEGGRLFQPHEVEVGAHSFAE